MGIPAFNPTFDRDSLAGAVNARLGQPCPSALAGDDRTAWQQYQGSLRSFGARLGTMPDAQVGLGVAGAAIPGASVLTNALGGAFGSNLAGGASGGLSGVGNVMMSDMVKQNMEFLALQDSIQNESRSFQTLSNVTKSRHNIANNSIRNIRA